MEPHWPPSPSVEDEESSLRHEITLKPGVNNKAEGEEALFRGTVDQYPIILDMNHQAEPKHDYASSTDNEGESVRTPSSDDSFGPSTPSKSAAGGKYGQMPTHSNGDPPRSGHERPHSHMAEESRESVTSRGRPSMPRIQTDLGSDLQGMITGQRRAPSPYSYTKPEASSKIRKQLPPEAFLSPESIIPGQPFPLAVKNNRHSSAQPRSKPSSMTDSEDSDAETRRRNHSRRKSNRESFSKHRVQAEEAPQAPVPGEKRSSCNGYPQSMNEGNSSKHSDPKVSSRVVVSQSEPFSRDTSYNPSAEDAWSTKQSHFVPGSEKRHSRESPYSSSTEEGRTWHQDGRSSREFNGVRLNYSSTDQKERPHLDLSDLQHTYHRAPTEERRESERHGKHVRSVTDGQSYLEPPAIRSPKAMEENVQKALKDNSGRSFGGSQAPSPCASPCRSPRGSPPRTSRGERRSKDYFSWTPSIPLPTPKATRPRAPSRGEENRNQPNLLAAVPAGAPHPRGALSRSRSSLSATEVRSNGNASKQTSGRGSGETSLPLERREPISRAEREHDKAIPKIIKVEEEANSRPGSRSGSTSYNAPLSATFDYSSARHGSYAGSPLEPARLNQRTFSYSATSESHHSRQPSSAKSTQSHFGSTLTAAHSLLPSTPRLPRSPTSSDRPPRTQQLSELPPCPRSVPEAGHHDWYTIVGMPQLDVCPSCMTVTGQSRFRDHFIPSRSDQVGQKVMCGFSRPWVRTAWAQIIKQRRSSLDTIQQIVRNSETTKPCPGKGSDVRAWYRLPDPETGDNVPNFDACSECVRSIEIIFPQLRGVFKRSGGLVQERTCDLNTQSRRFDGYLKLLDAAALRYDVERLREPNIQAFANHAGKTAQVRECTQDDMLMSQLWHFIPSLPEFTICEECFDQVVWPVVYQPVASSVNRTLQMVPGTQPSTGISCQLYSERMRKTFLEAVKLANFEYLRKVALRRYSAERMLQEKHKMLMHDMAVGRDRTAELQSNIEEWRKWE